ncbi:hypothetical protein KQX54_007257 [Cotesia glomerata]|uniref:Uncharacterized protein n=1 Tax=Cotesia glomerata TaxID=32391 RepID=A0AAV7IY19_COTGL|nr:hypothetical protein KQX54_007257 [Cotesia glomerata]
MTQDITDEVLEMDESNAHSLNPRDQLPEATPSPTGYRDYKPPAEVLSGGYQRNIGFTKNISPRREFGRDIEDIAHKCVFVPANDRASKGSQLSTNTTYTTYKYGPRNKADKKRGERRKPLNPDFFGTIQSGYLAHRTGRGSLIVTSRFLLSFLSFALL